ncbi:hypothetical protein C440_11353 [Haloferax mucosum ATCC BAA-1512]|uniref:Uncharacterized protein n=1 Tax=Haloferax mucosum ATCC BAA-1512 TaxID=662479 RepID=M0IFH0_9EURY|nr:hypothetical protein C440_11353 [Haloferax mucosum ATCC BAA-1512]
MPEPLADQPSSTRPPATHAGGTGRSPLPTRPNRSQNNAVSPPEHERTDSHRPQLDDSTVGLTTETPHETPQTEPS